MILLLRDFEEIYKPQFFNNLQASKVWYIGCDYKKRERKEVKNSVQEIKLKKSGDKIMKNRLGIISALLLSVFLGASVFALPLQQQAERTTTAAQTTTPTVTKTSSRKTVKRSSFPRRAKRHHRRVMKRKIAK